MTWVWLWTVLLSICLRCCEGTGSCKQIGCGGHDETCWCVESCWSFNDCCSDFASVCPEEPEISLGEINLLVTTDLHSWIEGRRHEPHFDATLGHVTSALNHLREMARKDRRDVFFFDNGDINDGTGLSASAPDHVTFLAPILQKVPYDALNIGNHELYQRNGYGLLPGPACPIVGLKESGYIDSWEGRYLTSNVVWSTNLKPVGDRYAVISGEFGRRVLVFGFLYNMEDHCDAVEVQKVEDVVNSSWFQAALDEPHDAVVVLAHMDYRDDLVEVLHSAIRQRVGPQTPIQILAGHSHIRGYRQLDNYSSVYEAGCKLDTVGFVSFKKSADGNGLDFEHANITGNVKVMAGALHMPSLAPAPTVQAALDVAKAAAKTEHILGCSFEHYRLSTPLQTKDSLWSFYMQKVIPDTLFDSPKQFAIVGTGALTYDIYPGTFTVDDAYKASPYGNVWLILEEISGEHLARLLEELNHHTRRHRDAPARHPSDRVTATVPSYASSGVPSPSRAYDLIFCDFDLDPIRQHLKPLVGHELQPRLYKPPLNTSSVLEEWFKKQPCLSFIGYV
ncbi:unnamed protein product [Durusdinium trenchii]|uniref:Uncharacterized protein PB2B2.06c n=2 Tax=Durusdinium trenchii TaxID=1381693 RepID=A0ABP0RW79_9DINO